MIDDTTTDNTKEIAENYAGHVKDFKFENFGKNWNIMLAWVNGKSDWIINIAPDETISPVFGKMLCQKIDEYQNTEVDGFHFPRRHWLDLEMTNEYTKANWYPDWQLRLIRNDYPRIHVIYYVHEPIVGTRQTIIVREHDINHFNLYWKKRVDYNLDEMDKLYRRLKMQQDKDGGKNIWPEEIV